ncbi:MAG: citryl-CoA synthetase large subunit [Clostridia bacterium]|nr:citryl-CoA synthetase large subunit [Clostridia bacterium]
MARLLENQVKDLLKSVGVKVPRYAVANSATEAKDIATQMGKEVVIKALLPLGKKGKAGAVKFASTPEEAYQRAGELLGKIVRHCNHSGRRSCSRRGFDGCRR